MAKFEKGKSGNPNGRPKGSLNEKTLYIRDWVISLIGSNGQRLLNEFPRLSRKEQWRVIVGLIPYVLPRQHEALVDMSADISQNQTINLYYTNSKEEVDKIRKEIEEEAKKRGLKPIE